MLALMTRLTSPASLRRPLLTILGLLLLAAPAQAQSWEEITAEAKGQTVYWNAWGGSEVINDYIAWVGDRVEERYGVELIQVKLADTADAVSRVIAEKAAGVEEGGSVDLIWINGENFASMKKQGLLFGPFTDKLPNFALVDVEGKPTTLIDFTIPTEGYEAPWGMARFNFIYDSARVPEPPLTLAALSHWAEKNPGRLTYPAPPDFIGSSFLKQALIGLSTAPSLLQAPVADAAQFERLSAPLWAYLNQLHPHLWRGGKSFPVSGSNLTTLLDDGEVDFAMAFNPAEAASLIRNGQLPETARSFVFTGGTIGNTHFVAIPFNASAKAGAMVVANFLMSPEAQARKQDSAYWGDATVLKVSDLPAEGQALFDAIDRHPAELSPAQLGPALLEPHPSWMTALEEAWRKRYAR